MADGERQKRIRTCEYEQARLDSVCLPSLPPPPASFPEAPEANTCNEFES